MTRLGVAVALFVVLSASAYFYQKQQSLRFEQLAYANQRLAQKEERQRQRAEQEREEARRLHYVANMNLTQQAWEQNKLGRVRDVLAETAGYPDRGFEWYYWQRQTHLELKTLRGHRGSVSAVAFSTDGQRIVTGSEDRTAKVWEAAGGKELLTLKGHNGPISAVAFSPDGQRIVTGSMDRTAKVWEAATPEQVSAWLREEDGTVE